MRRILSSHASKALNVFVPETYVYVANSKSISTPRENKFETIQFFRFIAALMVIIFHSIIYTSERLAPGFIHYGQAGFDGVSLFFVISGFVMIISSESLMEKPGGWKIFSMKRIIRILPIYWMVTSFKLLTQLFSTSLSFNSSIDSAFILKSYFFIPALNSRGLFFPLYNVGWTLNFEMFFYLFFAIALALRVKPIIFFSILFIPLSILSFYKTSHWPDIQFYFNPIIINFLLGMFVAKLVLNDIKLPQRLAVPIILLGLLYLFLPKTGVIVSVLPNYIPAFLVVYGGASIENSWSQKIPGWLIFLGAASYSLYLIHPIVAPVAPVILKFLNLRWPWLSVVLGILISVAAGTAFYQFCEKPTTALLGKLARKWKLI